MSYHALFSPSSAHRWINCPGSMAFPENREQGDSSSHADNGTVSHEWAAFCLNKGYDAEKLLGASIELNGVNYIMDEERAGHIQTYLDWVRVSTTPALLFVEHRLTMEPWIPTQGTCDAGGYNIAADEMFVGDLKYGMGEKVFAQNNAQGMSYALGLLNDFRLMGYDPKTVRIGICQPRLNHIDEWVCTVGELEKFASSARTSIKIAEKCIKDPAIAADNSYPDSKTCRWCRAKAKCPVLAIKVQEEMRADFDDVITAGTPTPPPDATGLSRAFAAVPLVALWCDAIRAEVSTRVKGGLSILGTDGQPLKFVEGKKGDRKWVDETVAESMLVGSLGDKAYQPRKILTASGAAKILDKKKSAATWAVFVDNISRAPGKPVLALGSDQRPPYSGDAASADDFDVQEE